jgi:RNA polymerase sigma-70 factor (ECF subfamily)
MPTMAATIDPPDGETALHAPSGFLTWVATLVHAHRGRLLAHARRHGLDAEEALDAVQQGFLSFLRLPQAQGIARDGDDALKLLTVVVRHEVMNRRRKERRHDRGNLLLEAARIDDAGESAEVLITRAEELARVRGCIQRMAYLQREVIRLCLLDEQPREAIATVLGISEGHVRVLLHRAREHVRRCPLEEMHEVDEVTA